VIEDGERHQPDHEPRNRHESHQRHAHRTNIFAPRLPRRVR
jgi:hypothetical protein